MSGAFHWPDYLPAFREAAAAQGFEETVLTDTGSGPLSAWTRGHGGRHSYLSAGIHGDEPAGPMALLDLMQSGGFPMDAQWTICPALNPTGLARQQRENPDGIDLNRDYWQRLSAEARHHAGWLEKQAAPDLFLSLHEDWETRGFYLYEINLGDDQPPRAAAILEAVSPHFAPEPARVIDGHRTRRPGWIFHEAEPDLPEGWPEAIFLAKHGCPLSFTFETPSQAALAKRVAAHRAAVIAALQCE